MQRLELTAALEKAAAALARLQKTDGSFESYSSSQRTPFRTEITYHTTFVPALILNALSGITETAPVRERLAHWLLAQRSPGWSFNYWAKKSLERKVQPYPDDLDDTFCALSALYRHDPALIDGAVLAHAVKLLIAAETVPGGPYRTWLVGAGAAPVWHDTDLAVNSNIAYFLRLVAEPLPNLTTLMDAAILAREYGSLYYPSAAPILYYIARAYQGEHSTRLRAQLRAEQASAGSGSPLTTALTLSGLLTLPGGASAHHAATAARLLLDAQQTDGTWPAEAYCIDPSRGGKRHYHGAAALTTALAAEALHAYRHYLTASGPKMKGSEKTDNTNKKLVVAIALRHTRGLGEPLRRMCEEQLHRIAARQTSDEILTLPHLFAASLAGPPGAAPSPKFYATLGAANLWGWAAYTIYDNIIDNDSDPTLLPAANAALRRSLASFQAALPGHTGFARYVGRIFDRIDAANAWELAHCRFPVENGCIAVRNIPHYGRRLRLADRSLGHTLTPLAVLLANGQQSAGLGFSALERALCQYLIARQLNDDVHDWEEDFKNGHISYPVAAALHGAHVREGAYRLEELLPRVQREFWYRTLPTLCQTITLHNESAKRLLSAAGLIRESSPLMELFGRISHAVERSRTEQAKAVSFLHAYGRR